MPGVARLNDSVVTGHICSPTTALSFPGQASVLANFRPMARVGDPTYVHTFPTKPPCPPHIAYINVGNPTVLVVGNPQGFRGCSADMGAVSSGSGNVYTG